MGGGLGGRPGERKQMTLLSPEAIYRIVGVVSNRVAPSLPHFLVWWVRTLGTQLGANLYQLES